MWCVCGCNGRNGVCRRGACCRGGIVVMDVIWRRLLCKYDLKKRYLFVLSLAKVRRVRLGSLSSELLMCMGVCVVFCSCLL